MANGLLDRFQPQTIGYGNTLLEDPAQYDLSGFEAIGQTVGDMAKGVLQSAKLPGRALRGEMGPPSLLNPEFTEGATQFGIDFGMLPALGTAAVAAPSAATLRAGAGGAPPIKDPMIVMHNIHEQPLQKAYERGGIPVPSLAITKADEPLSTFGTITLIGDPSMAKPSAKNPVYKTDAYTVRQPRVEINPNDTAVNFSAQSYVTPIKNYGGYYDPKDVAEDLLKRDMNGLSEIPLKAAFLREKGLLPDPETFADEYRFIDYVRETTRKEYGYQNWFGAQADRLKAAGGTSDERIFLGFTPSGRRKYASATLENLVKDMKGKGAGSEGMFQTPSSFRGKIAQKFRTEKEVKESRGLLGKEDGDAYEELHGQATEAYYKVLEDIRDKTGLDGSGSEDLLEFMILGGDKQFREFANLYLDKLPPSVFEDANKMAGMMRSLPTEYFEVKPQRGVGLGEFKGAIVPSNVEQSTLDALRESGITNIKKYDTQEQRAKLVKDFGDQFFTVPNVPVPLSGLLNEEQMTGDDMLRAGII